MTDRELLELAAKAAGVEFCGYCERRGLLILWSKVTDPSTWNPLEDDGDALRLAVQLAERQPVMVVGIFNRAAFPHADASVVHFDGSETHIEQDVEGDLRAAARRAIVRIAAEIGRAME